jgi:hypothetical protein
MTVVLSLQVIQLPVFKYGGGRVPGLGNGLLKLKHFEMAKILFSSESNLYRLLQP